MILLTFLTYGVCNRNMLTCWWNRKHSAYQTRVWHLSRGMLLMLIGNNYAAITLAPLILFYGWVSLCTVFSLLFSVGNLLVQLLSLNKLQVWRVGTVDIAGLRSTIVDNVCRNHLNLTRINGYIPKQTWGTLLVETLEIRLIPIKCLILLLQYVGSNNLCAIRLGWPCIVTFTSGCRDWLLMVLLKEWVMITYISFDWMAIHSQNFIHW